MQAARLRWLNTALWPLTVWLSFGKMRDHPADDYVERTSPIIAMAVGFCFVVAVVATIWFSNGPRTWFQVLAFFLPVLYGIGAMMYANREENFPE